MRCSSRPPRPWQPPSRQSAWRPLSSIPRSPTCRSWHAPSRATWCERRATQGSVGFWTTTRSSQPSMRPCGGPGLPTPSSREVTSGPSNPVQTALAAPILDRHLTWRERAPEPHMRRKEFLMTTKVESRVGSNGKPAGEPDPIEQCRRRRSRSSRPRTDSCRWPGWCARRRLPCATPCRWHRRRSGERGARHGARRHRGSRASAAPGPVPA